MLFDSLEFAVFLPVVFAVYWSLSSRSLKLQNAFLIVVSYIFYGWWDWRFLALIIFSSGVDYLVAKGLYETADLKKRKTLLWASISINIGLLGVFKYFDFFSKSFAEAFTLLGKPLDPLLLNIVLPVGISFYTFQTLSYSIDVYRRKLEPSEDLISFFAYVSFFPQLVAGPIERATNLLPQFYKRRVFSYDKAVDGMRQILWGLFKKVVIADNCAGIVDPIFNHASDLNGSTLALGAIFFAIQVYGDFSGYSDIAIGTARLFGFDLKPNFLYPYFSRDTAEFWRRWHISLSTWFRDYVYIPLGGSHGSLWQNVRNILVIFLVSGLWHGAKWTYVLWGGLHACCFIVIMLIGNHRRNLDVVAQGRYLPSLKELLQMGFTFALLSFLLIIFRAENLGDAWVYIENMFSESIFRRIQIYESKAFIPLIGGLFLVEWLSRERLHGLEVLSRYSRLWRWAIYLGLILIIVSFRGESQAFMYFQF
ncbi:D-alanyl-lipoteichoic acid acyltransferase DltB (MBOAT superfamily) [Roseivirga pacifica]|uniref:D-alanyl-lipoteichoic acid acyltransferase DltB, MBOAT superfamily n=1 Tax=Roseivirga pacifica TaxID=1267423 RepID=A0A1I0MBF2_9BACT|nr:MBOAT family O-acyltransferase [Roseivirga pacifica]RKQ50223.1 D-alanyl-lipoteichoic acid acyltransferase DltB (MBOAT superfamily) [Roseivirga pacifica]SEV85294.1 D-alanyl-lipoteichoic acid acyltransferase DltB, MBOAT superfamily [Roseivirga pacifica]